MAVTTAYTNNQLTVENLGRDLLAAEAVLSVILSAQKLTKAGFVDEHGELLVDYVSLCWDVLCKTSTTLLDFLDQEVESGVEVGSLSMEELQLTQ